MNAKILNLFLMIFVVPLFSACSNKEIIYEDRVVEVKTPVKCVTPKVECNFKKATYTEVLNEMRLCIEKLQKVNEVCK